MSPAAEHEAGRESRREIERRRWHRIETLFHRADELPEADRAAFLEAACDGDEGLRRRVEALLAADVDAVGSLAGLLRPADPGVAPGEEAPEPFPERIGPYRVLRQVGRGGVASVYLAERADGTFRKHVALKLVRRGLDTGDILDRLRQERQILARLDHPNIARLLDGGSTEDGRPYFVMEYVDGLPIDEYCRRNRVGIEQRLELIRSVCAAVQFAHRNLTIHRDIKPSNILVTADGTPKLLDFGIAKVLEADGSSATEQATGPTAFQPTRAGLRLLTPAYASPEQIRGEALSTATDVYSLGVLLYRLLSGAAPYDFDGLPFHRLETLVGEVDPPRPSQRLSAESLAAVGLDGTSVPRLRSRLRGDLDTIVSMALRKEPERRHGSAEQLAEDLWRHQRGLPVSARPDRWTYRTGKFLRRHRRGVAAAAVMAATLAAVVATFSFRLVEERNLAVQASARAEKEAATASRVTGFLQQIFEVSNPSRSLGQSITAVQLLNRGAAQIERDLEGEEEVQASLMDAIGQSYVGLGLVPEAEEHLERSFEIRRRLFRPPHEALAESHDRLGELRITQGRYEDAEHHFREAWRQREDLFGPDDPRVAESQADLGAVAHILGRLSEAEDLYRRARARLELRPGPRDPATLLVQSNFVTLLYDRGRLDEAEELGARVRALQQEVLGENHPDTIGTEATLAAVQVAAGHHERAEPLLRTLWRRQRGLLGDRHPDVALAANNLAAALFHLDRFDEAAALYRQALEAQTEVHGRRHMKTAATLLNLADLEARGNGDDGAARVHYEEALALRRDLVGPHSPELVSPLMSLGRLELRQGRPAVAARHLAEAVEILRSDRASELPEAVPWRLAEAQSLLGESLFGQGEEARGEELMRLSWEALRAELGATHARTRSAYRRLAAVRSVATPAVTPP
jgi:eukaryotic-like serine/threonine-protein kinase